MLWDLHPAICAVAALPLLVPGCTHIREQACVELFSAVLARASVNARGFRPSDSKLSFGMAVAQLCGKHRF
eukprot:6484866-Amphidinium_carterae.1